VCSTKPAKQLGLLIALALSSSSSNLVSQLPVGTVARSQTANLTPHDCCPLRGSKIPGRWAPLISGADYLASARATDGHPVRSAYRLDLTPAETTCGIMIVAATS